jgi:isopenicillin N synthase-like dioxygenase
VKLGLRAHTDYECFILFPPSPMTSNKTARRPCPVRLGTLTVNMADFLMRWANGLYRGTVHRAVTKPRVEAKAQYSVPYFFGINYDADIEELPAKMGGSWEGEGEGVKYKPLKAGEYVLERLRVTRALEGEERRKR